MESSSGSRHRRRSAQARREQRLRAEARLVQRMLRSFAELGKHRGGSLSKLGLALEAALKDVVVSGSTADRPQQGARPPQPAAPGEAAAQAAATVPLEPLLPTRPPGYWGPYTPGASPWPSPGNSRASSIGISSRKRSSVDAFSDAGGDTQDAGRFDEEDKAGSNMEKESLVEAKEVEFAQSSTGNAGDTVGSTQSLSSMLAAQVQHSAQAEARIFNNPCP